MHLISDTILKDFFRKHPDSEQAIRKFISVIKRAQWKTLANIKEEYNSVDYVGNDTYSFNIRGNNYRIILLILLNAGKAYVRFVGTHAEYDRIDASSV